MALVTWHSHPTSNSDSSLVVGFVAVLEDCHSPTALCAGLHNGVRKSIARYALQNGGKKWSTSGPTELHAKEVLSLPRRDNMDQPGHLWAFWSVRATSALTGAEVWKHFHMRPSPQCGPPLGSSQPLWRMRRDSLIQRGERGKVIKEGFEGSSQREVEEPGGLGKSRGGGFVSRRTLWMTSWIFQSQRMTHGNARTLMM